LSPLESRVKAQCRDEAASTRGARLVRTRAAHRVRPSRPRV